MSLILIIKHAKLWVLYALIDRVQVYKLDDTYLRQDVYWFSFLWNWFNGDLAVGWALAAYAFNAQ